METILNNKIREIIFDIICSCNKQGNHVNPYKKEIDEWVKEIINTKNKINHKAQS